MLVSGSYHRQPTLEKNIFPKWCNVFGTYFQNKRDLVNTMFKPIHSRIPTALNNLSFFINFMVSNYTGIPTRVLFWYFLLIMLIIPQEDQWYISHPNQDGGWSSTAKVIKKKWPRILKQIWWITIMTYRGLIEEEVDIRSVLFGRQFPVWRK